MHILNIKPIDFIMNLNEIYSARVLQHPVEKVYQAFADPNRLKLWWGPNGFTNSIHQFDLRPGGKWVLTMHGPDKANYENASVFKEIIPNKFVCWKRDTNPLFDMELGFESINSNKTLFSFKMIFETEEACYQIRKYVEPKNEENFDRLEQLLSGL